MARHANFGITKRKLFTYGVQENKKSTLLHIHILHGCGAGWNNVGDLILVWGMCTNVSIWFLVWSSFQMWISCQYCHWIYNEFIMFVSRCHGERTQSTSTQQDGYAHFSFLSFSLLMFITGFTYVKVCVSFGMVLIKGTWKVFFQFLKKKHCCDITPFNQKRKKKKIEEIREEARI